MYNVIVIGAGICGACIAYELAQYNLRIVVLEKEKDIAIGTTKANSGIVHAGYDPVPGTLIAACNVRGNLLMEPLCTKLKVPYKKVGSLVLAFDEEDLKHIELLYERGEKNGVPHLKLLTQEEVLQKEPKVNPEVKGALYAPTAGVVSPYELAIALLEESVRNGVEVLTQHEVIGIEEKEGFFKVLIKQGEITEEIKGQFIINAAGLYADEVYNLLDKSFFKITPNKGQYYLLDKKQGELIGHILFQCPTKEGKGVLVSPTAHGNLIVGPNAETIEHKADVSTTREGLEKVRVMASKTCKAIEYRDNIRNFAGNRALIDQDDFIIAPAPKHPAFINVAGIKSPGLTAGPAIAQKVAYLLQEAGLDLVHKEDWKEKEEKDYKSRYPRIICRCEQITEGEILEAIHSPIPACSVEAIKRRIRAGSGRCQGGFCQPKVVELLSQTLGIPVEAICLEGEGSNLILGRTCKGGGPQNEKR